MADYFIEKFKSDLNGYFNSGVMLFNLNKIKDKNREFIRLMKIARKNNNFFHDQNVFNIVYKNKVHFLDWNANVLNDLRSLACLRFEFDIIKNYQKLTTDPIFLHFTPTRPWDNSNVENANLWNSMKQELDKL